VSDISPQGKRVLAVVALMVCAGFMLLLLGGFLAKLARASQNVQAAVDMANYTAAIIAYSNSVGVLPIGNNATVTAVLTGRNSKGAAFLFLDRLPKVISESMGVGCQGDPFSLAPALSRRERENSCPACAEPNRLALFEDPAECSLSPGERVGVRGKNTFESPKRKLLLATALDHDSPRLNERGEFLDPDGVPYNISITTNTFTITRRIR
jgi:hypothetical protein